MIRTLLSVTIALWVFGNDSEAARILGVFPTASISHQIVFSALTTELSKRGHELVIFTSDPINNPNLTNYKEIDMHYTYELMINHVDNRDSWIKWWYVMTERLCDAVLAHPEMQRIMKPNSTEHFDLILVEYLDYQASFALQNLLKVPMIGVISVPMLPSGHYLIGNPFALAYAPGLLDPYTDDMNFWIRLWHVYRHIRYTIDHVFDNLERQDKLVRRYFGADMPHASDLGKEISLVLANNHPMMGYPRPNIPGVIDIGGFYLDVKMKGIDEDLKQFLDGAVDGFVYFSLGTNAKSVHLPAEKINTLISVFASLPYKVLWKWERDTLPGKPDNVFISKWLPQIDVLAHPNLKVFVYQGGLQSTEEAVHFAVPLVGIPIFADQEYNVRKMASVGVAKRVDFQSLPDEELKKTILEIITDEGYKKRMLKFRELVNDQKDDPMERAMWWIEYVLRHDGAPHLRPKVRHLRWYQRELVDVWLFVFFVALLISYITFKLARFLTSKLSIVPFVKVKIH